MAFNVRKFRECLSTDPAETVVFAADITAQPQYRKNFFSSDPFVHSKCSRALAIARAGDIVVLTGKLEPRYYEWLRSLGLGPELVVEYGVKEIGPSLAEIICKEPRRLLDAIGRSGGAPVYVPFYCGAREIRAAQTLGASLFGCDEEITNRYFNKQSFKDECANLKIPTVVGTTHSAEGERSGKHAARLEELTLSLLNEYPELVIRGVEGAAGSSVYSVNRENVGEVTQRIGRSKETDFVVEPKLIVVSSPNDQWVIDRDGEISHLGTSAQLFEGFKHVGNLKGLYFSERTIEAIREQSAILVRSMLEHGYKGVIGVDYIVTTSGIFPIENNARLNGSTFAIALVDELETEAVKIPYWKFFRAQTGPCTFDELRERLGSLLYKRGASNCVFPLDCDTLEMNGRFTPVIFAEDMYHIEFLEKALIGVGIARL